MFKTFAKGFSLALLLAGVTSGVSAVPQQVSGSFLQRVYAEVALGDVWMNWQPITSLQFDSQVSGMTQVKSWGSSAGNGFAVLADVGLRVVKDVSLEAGYTYLPTANFKGTVVGGQGTQDTAHHIYSYALFTAARLQFPVWHATSLFAKAGLALRHFHNDASNGYADFFVPMFDVGASYAINHWVSAEVQYMYLADRTNTQDKASGNALPAVNFIAAGIQTHF